MGIRQVVEPQTKGEANHHYVFSHSRNGALLFVCSNCPSHISIHRSTLYELLVKNAEHAKFLSKSVCPQKFPDRHRIRS